MSRKVLSTVLAVASVVALFVPIPGFQAIGIAGLKISTAMMLSAGLALGAALLAPKPRVSTSATDRLLASFDPNTPRKIWFGTTAGATDIRYHSYTNDQEFYHQILCHASHEVDEITEDWFDSEMSWSLGGGVTSKWSGYLTVDPKLVGSSANTVSIDANWGSAQRLTGCAYSYLRYKLTGASKKAESPFASAIPTRFTVRGNGALLPDIRETGCEADDQSTWAWFSDDSGNNPALQLLFYLIGWRINDKLAVGRGIPVARIDLDSFVTAANICDEAVALALGGTEPRYRCAGVFSESDDPGLVIGNLCAAMNAVLRDNGGQISVHCLVNDLAAPVASFTEAHIIGGGDWLQTPAVDEYFETVRGRYPDPSDTALYQLVDYPEVQIGEDDSRVDTFDLPCVQSASQAQRLAKMRLQRNLYRGVFSAVFNHKAWQVNLGDVVELSHVSLGWEDKLFRVASHSIGLDGRVEMVLNEENAAIYAWDAEESPAVVAAEPTAYDPLLSPFVQGLQELEALGIVGYLTNEAHTVPASSTGAVSDYSGASTEFIIVQNGTTDISDQFTLSTKSGGDPQALTETYNNSADPRSMTVTGAGTSSGNFGHSGTDTASLTIRATGDGDYTGVIIDKVFSLTKSKAGAAGGAGAAAKLLYLISDRQLITYDGTGSLSPSTQTTTFTVQPQNLTSSSYQISMTTSAGTTINANTYLASPGTLTPSGNNAILTGSAIFTITAANFDTARGATLGVIVTVTHVADGVADKISVLKAQDGSEGDAGAAAKTVYVISNRQIITYDGDGAVSPSTQTTTFQIQAQNLSTASFTVSMTTADGTTINANTYLTAGSGGTLTPSGNNGILTGALDFSLTAANFNTARAATQGVIVTVTHADGVSDKISIVKSADGAEGDPGAAAKTLYVISDRQIITYDAAGSPAPSTQTTAFTVRPQNLSSASFTVSMTTQAGVTINANTYLTATGGGTLTPSGNNGVLTGSLTFQMTAANFDTARSTTAGVLVTVAHADGVSDIISIVKSADGAAGDPGDPGDDGLNNATVELYYRNHTGATPTVPTDTLTYTFATSALSGGSLAGWSQTLGPESDGAFVFKITAPASSNTATDTIATGEWATPRLQAQSAVDPNALVLYYPMLYADEDQLHREWDTTSGTGTIGTAVDLNSPGGQVMTIAGARRIIAQAALAYDASALWQILEVGRATSGSPTIQGGVAGRAVDRTVLVNTAGADDDDSQHYFAADGATLGAVMQTYYGYFSGRGTTGFTFPSPNPLAPSPMHEDTAFVSPLWYAGTGTTAASYVELRRLSRVPTWTQGGTAVELSSDSFARQNGGSDFAGVVYTNYASAKGGRVSAIIPTAASIGEIGFTDESTPSNSVQTKWAIRWNADGNLDLYKNGSLAQADLTTYTAGAKIELVASIGAATARWSFYKNDVEIGTPDTTMPSGAIRGKVRLGGGVAVKELTATITGADGQDGSDGVSVSPSAMVFTIAAAANGTIKSGELPQTVTFIVTRGGVDLSEDADTDYTWSNPAGMTASLGGTNNKVLTITAMSATTTVTGIVTVEVDGVTVYEVPITLVKARDGFGSTPLGDDSLTINNTGSYTGTQGGPITRTCGPGNINIDVNHPYSASGTNSVLAGKVQYRTTPGSGGWTDIGAEEVDPFGASTGEPSVLSFQRSVSGPSGAENWEFQYINRRSSGSATLSTDGTGDVMTVSGEGT